MISDLKKLSEALDAAAPAPGTRLAAAVRAQKRRIEQEILEKGSACVTVGGRTFKVVPASRKWPLKCHQGDFRVTDKHAYQLKLWLAVAVSASLFLLWLCVSVALLVSGHVIFGAACVVAGIAIIFVLEEISEWISE